MRSFHLSALLFLFAVLIVPASAERGLTINEALLNGVAGKEIVVRPGGRIAGAVKISTSSSSIFKMHTGVWLPSWERENRSAMRTFIRSLFGGVPDIEVNIDLSAPEQPGTYYLLFSFDRKDDDEMWTEIRARADEQIFANGRAIKVTVDPDAVPIVQPRSRDQAAYIVLGGGGVEGTASFGPDNGYWVKIRSGDAVVSANAAIRFELTGQDPAVDLDMEIVDEAGRRRGFSAEEGSRKEISVVRSVADEMLYARVFAFKPGGEARFTLTASRVELSSALADPSNGRAKKVSDGYRGRDNAGEGVERSSWYAIALPEVGTVGAEIKGARESSDLEVWIYDDLGNIRAQSQIGGSALESALASPAEPGTWYIRVGALRSSDQSNFEVTVYLNRAAPERAAASIPPSTRRTTGADSLPVSFTVKRGKDFEGYVEVSTELEFLIEVFTGWGDLGVLDAITVYAPDGTVLWNSPAKGRGWEASRLSTKGAGFYRIVVAYSGDGERHGRVDVAGIKNRSFFHEKGFAISEGSLDERERKLLKELYDVMLSSEGEITAEERALLYEMEEILKER